MENKSFKVVSDLSDVKDAEVLYKLGDTIRFQTDNGRWVTFDFSL